MYTPVKLFCLMLVPAIFTFEIIHLLKQSINSFDKVLIFRKPQLNDVIHENSGSNLMQLVTQSSVVLQDGSELNWRWENLEKHTKIVELRGTQAEQDAQIAKVYVEEVKLLGAGRVLTLLVDHQEVKALVEEDSSYAVKWEDEGNTILVARYALFINSKGKFKLNRNFKIISGNKDKLSVEYKLPTQHIVINFLFKNNATHWGLHGVDIVVVDGESKKSAKYYLPLTSCFPIEARLGANLFCYKGAKFSNSHMTIKLGHIQVQPYLNGLCRFSKEATYCVVEEMTFFTFLFVLGSFLTFIFVGLYSLKKYYKQQDRQKQIRWMFQRLPYPQKEIVKRS